MPFIHVITLYGVTAILMETWVFYAYLVGAVVGLGLVVPWLAHLPQPEPQRGHWSDGRIL